MEASLISITMGNRIPDYTALSQHIDILLHADERLIAAFWDDAQPASVNLENIAYWLGQSAATAIATEGRNESP